MSKAIAMQTRFFFGSLEEGKEGKEFNRKFLLSLKKFSYQILLSLLEICPVRFTCYNLLMVPKTEIIGFV